MKLNKPEVTESQTVLEDYVTSLLIDPFKKPRKGSQAELIAVTKINLKEFESEPINANGQIEKQPSKRIQQKHTEKINQELAAYSHQKSHQKNFKDKNEKDPRLQGVEKLLAKIALANVVAPRKQNDESDISIQVKTSVEVKADELSEVDLASSQASFAHREKQPLKDILGNVFQTLVFEVGKLPLAVPLIKLGGIVNVSEQDITPLVGTPDWFMGLAPHEKGNLMVVDTQQFLMPEQKTDQQQAYQYLIILDDSLWALACHSVGDAKNLAPEDIRWSSGSSKRPWFAGMVVEYMSALIEVDHLINMLTENVVD